MLSYQPSNLVRFGLSLCCFWEMKYCSIFLDVQDSADEHTRSATGSSCNFFRLLEFLMAVCWHSDVQSHCFSGLQWNLLVAEGHFCDVWNIMESLYLREVHMMWSSLN